MNKNIKLMQNPTKKELVLEILEKLENRNYSDAIEVLDCAKYFLRCTNVDFKEIAAEIDELIGAE